MSTTPTTTDTDTTGRGAWSRDGFPVDPVTGKGFTRYYARHLVPPVTGSQKALGIDYEGVYYGVRAIQTTLGIYVDGLYGTKTEAAVKALQTRLKLVVDGTVGPQTAKALWSPMVAANTSSFAIPDRLLHGMVQQESMKDPGAVGATTPADKGLVQINSAVWSKTITLAQAFDPTFALNWAADRLRDGHDMYLARTGAASKGNDRLSWDCAVARHNSPKWAGEWADAGTPPNSLIERYVARVREYGLAWT